MKKILKHILVALFLIISFHCSALGQEIEKQEIDKMIPKIPKILLPDTILLAEFNQKHSAIETRSDFAVRFDLSIDLNKKIAKGVYEIINKVKKEINIEYSSPLIDYKLRKFKIQPREMKKDEFTQEISISRITPTTSFTLIRPYLVTKKPQMSNQLLVTDYNIKMQVIIPDEARMLKSSIPFQKMEDNLLICELSGVKIIPPIYLWYTTAEVELDLVKNVHVEDTEVLVTLVIKNKGPINATNLMITTQFPANAYQPDREASDGEFILQNDVMYRWKKHIDEIKTNMEYNVKYKLLKDSTIPYNGSEILIYDQNGELLIVD